MGFFIFNRILAEVCSKKKETSFAANAKPVLLDLPAFVWRAQSPLFAARQQNIVALFHPDFGTAVIYPSIWRKTHFTEKIIGRKFRESIFSMNM